MTTTLQGYGQAKAIEVKDLQKGTIITWNYGYKSEVVEMTPSETGKTFTVLLKSLQDGIMRERRLGATTLVATT